MVMGNVSSGRDDEGTSGVKNNDYEVGEENSNPDPMLHSPPHTPRALQPPSISVRQNPMAPLTIPGETSRAQNQVLMQNARQHNGTVCVEKKSAAMIVWSRGGKEVAITGSWDNWERIETLHPLNKDFIITKILLPGVYHYRFIVDGQMTYASELPWNCDNAGIAYNILDLESETMPSVAQSSSSTTRIQATIKQHMMPLPLSSSELSQEFTPNRLAEFESPPSPISSYDNEPLIDSDFIKYPPDLPPQLQMTILNEPSSTIGTDQYLPVPNHTTLNHLYIQNSGGNQPVALGVTHRFLQKYVTVIIYKAYSR
ncbi:hypothetical protein SLA2020_024540 [Shorea laevis]